MMKSEKHLKGKKESTELKKQLEEYRETLQRLQAEFENSQKRNERDGENFRKLSNASLVKEMLPIIDSFDSAIEKIKKDGNFDRAKALEGLTTIKNQFIGLLKQKGLGEINVAGQQFDPIRHECVGRGCDKGKPDHAVLEELQKGYLFQGVVLRPAKVRINKKELEENGQSQT